MQFIFFIFISLFSTVCLSQCPSTTLVNNYPNITSPKCGKQNGIIEIKANGLSGVTYSLQEFGNYSSEGLFTGLGPAQYTIYMKDGRGCIKTFTTTLESVSGALITSVKTKDSSCDKDDGEIEVFATGEELSYKLNNGELQTSNKFTNLAGGQFTVTVIDKNDCETRQTVQLKQGSLLINSIIDQPSSCTNKNGSITIKAQSDNELEYMLEGETDWQSSNRFSNLLPGSYTVLIKESTGCQLRSFVYIEDLFEVEQRVQGPLCGESDGFARFIVRPAGNYEFSIDGGDTFNTTGLFENLSKGDYDLIIRGVGNDCNKNYTFSISEDVIVIPDVNVETEMTACTENSGKITITSSVTDLRFIIFKYNFLTGFYNYIEENTTGKFTGLSAGSYIFRIITPNGCETGYFSELIEIDNDIRFRNEDLTFASCNSADGKITINAFSTKAEKLTYKLDDGEYTDNNIFENLGTGSYQAYVKSESGCVVVKDVFLPDDNDLSFTEILTFPPTSDCAKDGRIEAKVESRNVLFSLDNVEFQSSSIFSGLGPGVYKIYLKNVRDCLRESGEITFPGDIIIESTNVTDDKCEYEKGKVEVIATGQNLTYSLDDVNFQESNTFNNLAKGNYTVYVSNGSDCKVSRNFKVENEGRARITAVEVQPPSCGLNNASAKITFLDEGGTYRFKIDDGAYQEGTEFSELSSRTHVATIINDDDGCLGTFEFEVPDSFPITSQISNGQLVCGDSVVNYSVEASGGVGTLLFSLDGGSFQSNPEFLDLSAGEHTVVIKDEVGCQLEGTIQVGKSEITGVQVIPPFCGLSNADITIDHIDFGSEYQFTIDGGQKQTSAHFQGIASGNHIASVFDELGCEYQFPFQVGESFPIVSNIENNLTYCANPTANIIVEATGGVGELQYAIDNSSFISSNEFLDLPIGDYLITIRDKVGCQISEVVQIGRAEISDLDVTTTSCGDNNGKVKINNIDFGGSYTFQINGGVFQNSNEFKFLPPGEHTITVMDEVGCTDFETFTISESFPIKTNLADIYELCSFQEGTISVKATGGVGQLQYSIANQPFTTNPVFSNLANGQYFIQVKDEVNCIVDAIVEIGKPCVVSFPTAISPNGDATNDYFKALYHETIPILEFEVFNRWGEKIYFNSNFNSTDLTKWWNAQNAQDGVYLANVVYELQGEQQVYSGNFLVLK